MIDTAPGNACSLWTETESEKSRDPSPQDCIQVVARITSKIEARLPGRIRDLVVSASGKAIVLSGSCHTYYSKQMAQHTARGLLEHDCLINKIKVLPPK